MTIDNFARIPGQTDDKAIELKREVTELVLWAERNSPRSKQKFIGPSELGTACDRRLAYRLAGYDPINTDSDPWPAIVGSSIHAWMEKAVHFYQTGFRDLTYRTELEIQVDPLVRGHSDVLRVRDGTVIDWKTAGTEAMRKVKRDEIPEAYKTQTMLYGFGLRKAGFDIRDVALVFLPRAGWLSGLHVWRAPYDEARATAALARMYAIADKALELRVDEPEFARRLDLIPATPGGECAICPFYNRTKFNDDLADASGCPGR